MKIYQSCMAHSLLFDSNRGVTVVNVTANGMKPFIVGARKEVIVSSGFIHSPQLLMVPGIGPREAPEKYNITFISDLLHVGQNLRDTPNVRSIVDSMNVPSKDAWTRSTSSFQAASEI
ncbi:hypothetical protein BDU57DRAFT_540716 [Ampelomyces quisqualis]|uniref:Glucose-methanol-choline oxidoreductase N-terminal domain-containing protein n=1 Tax=Ampelomyces quisqualis TaxID=50730 RepID=A0A6A5QH01_AMPQU|nr:hypothetical protein BDU57DRAFT_540716 [Ampelomyces quisqualis]